MKSEMISKLGLSFVVSILMLSNIAFAQGLQGVIGTLQGIGVFQFYLPFILVFAILYALLTKSKIFGEKSGINVIIALAVSGFIMVYTPVGIGFSQFLTNFVGNVVVVILTLGVLLILGSMLQTGGIKISEVLKGSSVWIAILLLVLVVFGVFIASGGTSIFPGLTLSPTKAFSTIGGISSATWAIIILIVGTGLIVWFLGKGSTPGT